MRAEAIPRRLGLSGSLRASLLLLCGLFLALFTAMLVYWVVQTRQFYLGQAMGTVEELSGAYTSYTEQAVHEIDFSLLLVQGYARQLGSLGPRLLQSVAPALELGRRHMAYVSNLIVVDARGVVVSATNPAVSTLGRNVADREYFAVPRASSDATLHVGAVFSTRWVDSGELRFPISRRLTGPKGEFLGVVVALVDARALAQEYARQLDDPAMSVTLIRTDGMVLTRTPYLRDRVGQMLPFFPRFKGNPPFRSSYVVRSEIDQVMRVIAQRRFDGMPLLIAVTQLQDVALKRWLATLPLALGIWLLAVLSTLGLAALVLRQQRWRERAQVELQRSLEVFNEAQRMAQIGSIDHDLVSGEQRWSDEMFRLLEIDRDRPGLSVDLRHERIHPEDRERVAHSCGQSKALHLPYKVSYRLQLPKDRVKWISESCTYIYDGSARPVREVITLQDITVARQAEEALIRLHAELDARAGQTGRDPYAR